MNSNNQQFNNDELNEKCKKKNNLERIAIACRKHYDSRKDDPEYIAKRKIRVKARQARLKQEKEELLRSQLSDVPQEVQVTPKVEPVMKENKKLGRPRKYL